MRDDTASRPVGALVHALKILRHLAAEGTPRGVTGIARATGVNGSTCFNILRTLSAEGLVVFDPDAKTYRPGLGLVELAVGVLGASPADLIRPQMERFAQRYGALLCLWQITDTDRLVLIDRAFDRTVTRVEMPAGMRLPALIGAVGRVIAARRALPRPLLEAQYRTFRWQNPPGFEAYLAGVEDARATGYAIDNGQLYTGVDVIGAVIADARGLPRYGLSSVSLTGQLTGADQHAAGRDLADTCQRIERALFAAPPPTATAP